MKQTDADADREETLFGNSHEPSKLNSEERHWPKPEFNPPKSPQGSLKKAFATIKVGKGYGGDEVSAVSAFGTSSITADLAPAGPDPPVTATSADARAAGASELSQSSGLATSNNPGDLVLLGQPYTFAGSAENLYPCVSNTDNSATAPASAHVFPEVGSSSPRTPATMAATASEPPKLGRKHTHRLDFYIPVKLDLGQPSLPEGPRTPAPPPHRHSTRKRCHLPLVGKPAGGQPLQAAALGESVLDSPCFMRGRRRDSSGDSLATLSSEA